MAHNPLDKIHALDEIEQEIIMCLQSAGFYFNYIRYIYIYILNSFLFPQARRYRNSARKNLRKKVRKPKRSNSSNHYPM